MARQANIKTDNQLLVSSVYGWQYFIDTLRSTGTYIIFYQGGTIDHVAHVPVQVAQ